MTDDKKYDLLIDIAKLIKKYGADTLLSLYDEVSSLQFDKKLAAILLKAGQVSKQLELHEKPKQEISLGPQRSFRSQLVHLNETQPRKAGFLITFYDNLTAKRSLPTLRDINDFIADNGLQPLKAKSRKNAITQLVKQLLNSKEEDIEKIAGNIPVAGESDDRSLAGWSDIILKKKPKGPEEVKPPKQEDSNNDV